MFEEIFVLFTPADWKYHYDCIRMVTPRGNLVVPIHAYPIMNPNQKYLPSLLDLGKATIGDKIIKKVELHCTVPVLFDFEMEYTTAHSDIMISPMSGEICDGKVEIEIEFNPSTATTASAEIKLIISEFEFEPQIMKVIASGMHKGSNAQAGKTLLNTSKLSSPGKKSLQPKRLPELADTLPAKSRKSMTIRTMAKPVYILGTKNVVDRSIVEQQFSNEYLQLD
jgi:hypothetical protein